MTRNACQKGLDTAQARRVVETYVSECKDNLLERVRSGREME